MVVEVAAALVLLTGAGLMIQTMMKLRAIDLGFRSDHLLTLRTPLGPKYSDPVKIVSYVNRVLDQVNAIPGVRSAAFASTLPFQSIGNTRGYLIEGQAIDRNYSPDALFRVGSAKYLQTLGVKLIEGRLFTESDTLSPTPVFIINETMARHYWPNESAVGHRISFRSGPTPVWSTVVGVVADVHERGYDIAMKPGIYTPITPLDDGWDPRHPRHSNRTPSLPRSRPPSAASSPPSIPTSPSPSSARWTKSSTSTSPTASNR